MVKKSMERIRSRSRERSQKCIELKTDRLMQGKWDISEGCNSKSKLCQDTGNREV